MTVQHPDLTAAADIHEPKGAAAAASGDAYIADGAGSGSFQAFTVPYDLAMQFAGKPANAEVMLRLMVVRDIALPANLSGSLGDIGTSATAQTVLIVKDDGVVIGTITISTVDIFTFATTSGSAKTVAEGSLLTIENQATTDATAADITVTLEATVART